MPQVTMKVMKTMKNMKNMKTMTNAPKATMKVMNMKTKKNVKTKKTVPKAVKTGKILQTVKTKKTFRYEYIPGVARGEHGGLWFVNSVAKIMRANCPVVRVKWEQLEKKPMTWIA